MSDDKGPINLHFFDGLRGDSIATTMKPAPAPKVFEVTLSTEVVATTQDEAEDAVKLFLTALAEQNAMCMQYQKYVRHGRYWLARDMYARVANAARKLISKSKNITFGSAQKVT